MFVFRMLGGWFLVAAIMALVYDGTLSLGSIEGWTSTSLAELWQQAHGQSFVSLRQTLVDGSLEILWSPMLETLLGLPAWLWFTLFGVVLYIIGQPKRQIDVFAN